MNCLEFRRELGIDPQSNNVDFVQHRQTCTRCAEAYERSVHFEAALRRALAIAAPAQLAESILLAQATKERRHRRVYRNGGLLALAAALVLAIGVGMRVEAKPLSSLAVEHLNGEAMALTLTAQIPASSVREAFAKRGVALEQVPEGISYVACCPVDHYLTVHMVMPESDGPVTVIYVANDHGPKRKDFEHNGWQGRSIPLGQGTLILIAQQAVHFDSVETLWRAALQPQAPADHT